MDAFFNALHEPVPEKGADAFPDGSIIPAGGLKAPPEPANEKAAYCVERLPGIR